MSYSSLKCFIKETRNLNPKVPFPAAEEMNKN